MNVTALDYETHLIGPCNLAPRAVCASIAGPADKNGYVVGNGDRLDHSIRALLTGDDRLVLHNAAFDLAVTAANWPEFIPLIFSALGETRISDTKVREKLIVIGDQGNMRLRRMPNGKWTPILYDLASLERIYYGRNREAEKGKITGDMTMAAGARGDTWRLNFDTLDGRKAADYPAEAYDYARKDAVGTLEVHHAQEGRFKALGFSCPQAESLHVAAAYCLYSMSARGIRIDPDAVERLRARLAIDLGNDNLPYLIGSGVLRPALPARAQEGARRHAEECPRDGYCACPVVGKAPQSHVEGCKRKDCVCPPKMLSAEKASVCKEALHALIVEVCEENEIEVKRTDPSDKFPEGSVCADAEVLEGIKDLHPILTEYAFRQNLLGLQDRELPRMTIPLDRPQIVHPSYDELKVTGRTSCSASELYPSGNIQNVDPRARECYIPRDGFLLLSVDYSGMELVTLAQTVYSLLGHSSLRDQINSGIDPHAFLGAQIAYALAPDFRAACNEAGIRGRKAVYEAFLTLKDAPKDSPELKFFVEYRTLAKPTGLGYPGGLGPKTFVAYCKGQYGLTVTFDQAKALRDLWFDVYPEMHEFFRIVKDRRDGANDQIVIDKKTKEPVRRSKFWYRSPLGMLRRGCSFTEAANGCALQTPGAELAKMGLISVCQAAMDPSQGSILYGRLFPLAFIHDEILSEIADGPDLHEVAVEKGRLMVEGGKVIVPDVDLKVELALMHRWRKDAKPVYENGRLVPWIPKERLI